MSGDLDEDFEQFDDELLQISRSCTLLSSDQYIVSKISINTEFRKL